MRRKWTFILVAMVATLDGHCGPRAVYPGYGPHLLSCPDKID